jgi:hypothetical protein
MLNAGSASSLGSDPAPGHENLHLSRLSVGVLLSSISLVAILLRFHAIAAKSLWLDEGFSVELVRQPWAEFFRVLWIEEANMSLYYLLLRLWLHLGSSEAFIRGLSALISAGTVPLLYFLGKRLFGRGTGLMASWLLAINAYHIRYAQEARSYSLVIFLCVLATWLLVRNLQEPSSATWRLYAMVCLLAVYSHFFGALVFVAHGISLLFLRRSEVPWRALLRSLLWLIYLMIPIEWFVMTTGTGMLNWIPPTSGSRLLHVFVQFAGNYGLTLLTLASVALGLAAYGGWKTWQSNGRTLKGWAFVLVFLWLFAPVLMLAAGSIVKPLFVIRYLSPCLPALILIVAVGITRLRRAVPAWTLCAAISAGSILGTASYYRHDFDLERGDWRAATTFVLDHAQPGDSAVFYISAGRMPFEFYRSERHPTPVWPEVGQSVNGFTLNFPGTELRPTDSSPTQQRIWLVLEYATDPEIQPAPESVTFRTYYDERRRLISTQTFSDISVLLFGGEREDSARVADRCTPSPAQELGVNSGCATGRLAAERARDGNRSP